MEIPAPTAAEIEERRQIARRICCLADRDLLIHPDDKFVFSPLVLMSLYQHVRIFAGGFGGFHDFTSTPLLDRESVVATIIAQGIYAVGVGVEELKKSTNKTTEELSSTTALADILDSGLRNLDYGVDSQNNPAVFFFVLALYELSIFVDAFNSAYRTEEELLDFNERISSDQKIITAATSLNLAMLALEKGINYHTLAAASNKLNDLNGQLRVLQEEENALSIRSRVDLDRLPQPKGGDSLTPLVWQICNRLYTNGTDVRPRTVMIELKSLAQKQTFPLIGDIAGGVKFETGEGNQCELSQDALRKRIGEWRAALKTGD